MEPNNMLVVVKNTVCKNIKLRDAQLDKNLVVCQVQET